MPDDLALVLNISLVSLKHFALFGFCVTPGHLGLSKACNSVTFNYAYIYL